MHLPYSRDGVCNSVGVNDAETEGNLASHELFCCDLSGRKTNRAATARASGIGLDSGVLSSPWSKHHNDCSIPRGMSL